MKLKRTMTVSALDGCGDCILASLKDPKHGGGQYFCRSTSQDIDYYFLNGLFHSDCPMIETKDCSSCWHSKNGNGPCPCDSGLES